MSSRIAKVLVGAVFAALTLAGCASDPRFKQGLSWVEYNETQKRQLQAQGFPQYNHD